MYIGNIDQRLSRSFHIKLYLFLSCTVKVAANKIGQNDLHICHSDQCSFAETLIVHLKSRPF